MSQPGGGIPPWAGVALSALVTLAGLAAQWGGSRADAESQAKRIARVDEDLRAEVARREQEDGKLDKRVDATNKRVDDTNDRLRANEISTAEVKAWMVEVRNDLAEIKAALGARRR